MRERERESMSTLACCLLVFISVCTSLNQNNNKKRQQGKRTNLLGTQQLSQSKVIDTSIVRNNCQVLAVRSAVLEGSDQVLGDTAQTESTDHQCRSRGDILDGLLGRVVDLAQVLELLLLVLGTEGGELATERGCERGDRHLLLEMMIHC